MKKLVFLLIAICILLIFTTALTYKRLNNSELYIKNNWSKLQICYQDKSNLFPALISATQNIKNDKNGKYFISLAKIRNQYSKASTLTKYKSLDSKLCILIDSLIVDYPQIESDKVFLDFKEKQIDIDKKLIDFTNEYETSVANYNKLLDSFPTNLLKPFLKLERLDIFSKDTNSPLPISYLAQVKYLTSIKKFEQANYSWSIN